MLSTVLFCSSECDTWPLHQDLVVLFVNYCVYMQDWGWCVCEANRGGAAFTAANRFQGSDISGVNGRLPRELITEHFQSVFIQLCLSTSLHVNHKTACERGVSQLTALIFVRKKIWTFYSISLCLHVLQSGGQMCQQQTVTFSQKQHWD